tara:strand:- start:35975 stop:36283 length:309 start_codon:yes stop_codon:yes gene_type:complete
MIINDNVLRMKEVMEDAGNIIYTKLNHVTKSGMTRYISVICIIDNRPYDYTYLVSKILDWKTSNLHGGIKVGGVGMDMGHHLVGSISYALYENDDTITQRWI